MAVPSAFSTVLVPVAEMIGKLIDGNRFEITPNNISFSLARALAFS